MSAYATARARLDARPIWRGSRVHVSRLSISMGVESGDRAVVDDGADNRQNAFTLLGRQSVHFCWIHESSALNR